jgi:hypothetical protein
VTTTPTTNPWLVKPTQGQGGGDGKPREMPDAGQQPAACVGLIDLGTQEDEYKGVKKTLRQVAIVWELTDAPMTGYKDRNHVMINSYNLFFNDQAKLRQLIEKWFGKQFSNEESAANFDMRLLIDPKFRKCVANVLHAKGKNSGKVYAKLEDVSKPHRSLVVPDPKHKPFVWNLADDVKDIPDWVPWLVGEPVAEVVKRSQEASGRKTVEKATPPSPSEPPDEGDVGSDDPNDQPPF